MPPIPLPRRSRSSALVRPLLRVLLPLLAVLAVAGQAAPASAAVTMYNEPTYTKTSGNNAFWWQWTTPLGNAMGGGGPVYAQYLCFRTFRTPPPNGPQVLEETSNGSAGGPGSSNCTNWLAYGASSQTGNYGATPFQTNTVLQDGHRYDMCATGYYPNAVIYQIDAAGNSVCPWTIIDRNKPAAGIALAGGAEHVRDAAVPVRIDYADATSPPWAGNGGVASNWTCVASAPCVPGGAPNQACSVPADPTSRTTSFSCTTTVPSDGRWNVCTFVADSAIPDNATGPNQFAQATSNNANLSTTVCDDVVVDRAAPTVTVGADRTTITAGESVAFSATVADATSGAPSPHTWDFGDGIGASTGTNPTHTYAQPGTYVARMTARDLAGNEATDQVTITVNAAPGGGSATGGGSTGGGTTGGGSATGGGSSTGGGSTGGGSTGGGSSATGGGSAGSTSTAGSVSAAGGASTTTPPTASSISKDAGGGGTQQATVGALKVVAAKRFDRTKRRFPLRLTLSQPGAVEVTLSKSGKRIVRGTLTAKRAGTAGLALKVPKGAKAGSYTLRVVYRPTRGKAVTRNLKVTFTAPARTAKPRAVVGIPAAR